MRLRQAGSKHLGKLNVMTILFLRVSSPLGGLLRTFTASQTVWIVKEWSISASQVVDTIPGTLAWTFSKLVVIEELPKIPISIVEGFSFPILIINRVFLILLIAIDLHGYARRNDTRTLYCKVRRTLQSSPVPC